MAEASAEAALELPTEQALNMDSSSFDSNSSNVPSPSSAATSFELPSEIMKDQAASSSQLQNPSLQARSPTNPPSSFLTLPSDIHHLILTNYLPYDSIVALRSTSSHFHSLIPPSTLRRLRQNVISKLLANERALFKKWITQPYGRYDGRPTNELTCYSCLQSLPTTDFFAQQTRESRGLGRRRAAERWCKPCGLKYGKIRHGRWMTEVSYSIDDEIRHQTVMGCELNVKNSCMKCPEKDGFEGQHVWWGCVDCFQKEEKRLQKQDSDRRRDVRGRCSRVKHRVKAFVEPQNLRSLANDLWWRARTELGRHALVRRGYSIYWWATDENLWRMTARACGRVARVLDPMQMQEPGQRLGRKTKKAVVGLFESTKKKQPQQKDESGSIPEVATSTMANQDCILCCAAVLTPPLILERDTEAPTPNPAAPIASLLSQSPNHQCIPPPHREVRCWRCWRAKRSRRRRRYDNGMAYGLPLPKERWCDGCQAEQETFVAMRRARKGRSRAMKEKEEEDSKGKEEGLKGGGEEEEEEEEDIALGGLFGES